jgi:hypothetical protein
VIIRASVREGTVEPIKTPPVSAVMVLSIRRRAEADNELVIRLSSAVDEVDLETIVTSSDDDALAAVRSLLAMMRRHEYH